MLQRLVIQPEIWSKYHFSKQIGEGASGKVFLASKIEKVCIDDEDSLSSIESMKSSNNNDPLKQQVAIKVLDKNPLQKNNQKIVNLIQEIKVHWALQECDGILHLLEIFEDDNFVCLVLEYQSEGSLLSEILKGSKLAENQVCMIMAQLILTMDFIHKKGVVHRDIKLDNILINKREDGEYKVKIADFGMASFIKVPYI